MTKKLVIFFSAVFLFSFFVFFSYLVHRDLFTQFDFNTTVRLQDHIPRRFDSIFSVFSLLGSFEVSTIVLLIILVLRRKLKGVFALFLFFAIHFFELFGKIFVDHPGTPFLFHRYNLWFQFPSSYVQPGSSYPSGHAARSMFLGALLILYIIRKGKITSNRLMLIGGIVGFDVLMLLSRVYLAEHWASDVIGGSFLGVGLGLLASLF